MAAKQYISDNPELMADWDAQENAACSLYPDQITTGSRKRVHWKCHVCVGKWDTVVKERRGCPYCNGFKAFTGSNDLAALHPELLPEWDYEKNRVRPEEVTPGSQKKVLWKCSKGHSWDMLIRSRVLGQGCPCCNNRRVLKGYNDLATLRPDLAAEWDSNKNGSLKPSDVIPGSKNMPGGCALKGIAGGLRLQTGITGMAVLSALIDEDGEAAEIMETASDEVSSLMESLDTVVALLDEEGKE